MIEFKGGPAHDATLSLRRIPILLRVVVDADSVVDALDQLYDQPRPGERVFVYKRVSHSSYHLKSSCRSLTGWHWSAVYHFVDMPIEVATVRSTDAWRRWAHANAEAPLKLDAGQTQRTFFAEHQNEPFKPDQGKP